MYKGIAIRYKNTISGCGVLCYKIFRLILLLGISYIMINPILRQLSYAMATAEDITANDFVWIPKTQTFANFINMKHLMDVSKQFLTTIKICVISTILQIISCSLIGYGLARYKFKGNFIVFLWVVMTIIMPVQANVIPLFLDYRFFDFFGIGTLIGKITGTALTANLLDTHWVYFLPAIFGVGLNAGLFIFIFRQFFMNMPKELEEAARIDGCGPLKTYVKVIVPNAAPIFVTVGLLSTVFYWNDKSIADVLLTTYEKKSMTAAAYNVQIPQNTSGITAHYVASLAALLLTIHAPLMLVFILGQKFFVESMDRSGIKG